MSYAQNVTTWHNDNNRTGWQSNETMLKASGTGHVSQTNFGLLWQWPVDGWVFAQPLAVTLPQAVGACANPCSLIFVATEKDKLYAFNAANAPPNPIAVWTLDLANYIVVNGVHGTYLTCSDTSEVPCPSGVLGPYEGVTGTPVIDMASTPPTLCVTAAVSVGGAINFYLFAIDITTGLPRGSAQNNPVLIAGSVTGQNPGTICTSDYPGNGGQIHFESDPLHIQRAGLLLLNGKVYVAFASGNGETNNGWIFGYSFNYTNNTFSQTAHFNSTPYGTGGGIWQSGAGLSSDGTAIYAAVANGTFDLFGIPAAADAGDSLLKLNPSNLAILSYYTPFNVNSYQPPAGTPLGLCPNDEDFGSGGVVVLPSDFTYNSTNVVITADKQSNLYVSNQLNLGGFNANTNCTNNFNNVQCITTPNDGQGHKLDINQGYWGTPAYWKYASGGTHYMLYSVPTTDSKAIPPAAPFSMNAYQLVTSGTSGPIPDPPTANTGSINFCPYSPTPSVSSNGTTAGSGIVWAIENQNKRDDQTGKCDASAFRPAVLHAFDATNLAATELYTSKNMSTQILRPTAFSTPTIFNGKVFITSKTTTTSEVDVFGLCGGQNPACLP